MSVALLDDRPIDHGTWLALLGLVGTQLTNALSGLGTCTTGSYPDELGFILGIDPGEEVDHELELVVIPPRQPRSDATAPFTSLNIVLRRTPKDEEEDYVETADNASGWTVRPDSRGRFYGHPADRVVDTESAPGTPAGEMAWADTLDLGLLGMVVPVRTGSKYLWDAVRERAEQMLAA